MPGTAFAATAAVACTGALAFGPGFAATLVAQVVRVIRVGQVVQADQIDVQAGVVALAEGVDLGFAEVGDQVVQIDDQVEEALVPVEAVIQAVRIAG